jgi:hypothetical protein
MPHGRFHTEADQGRACSNSVCTLSYPSLKDFKWVIRSKQIKDCLVTVQDVDVALKILGTNMTALKGKTTQSKPNLVAKDFVKVPVELLKLHEEVFLTVDIFFLNKIPFS